MPQFPQAVEIAQLYLLSFDALLLLCAAVVDLVFHYKLQKINMAEALKSVE